jgi:hypothetical protein
VESTEATESIEPPKTWDPENVRQWLFSQIEDLKPGKKIGLLNDLFEHGFDRYVTVLCIGTDAYMSALVH